MKAAAKQNCYFFCQRWYQRQAATDHWVVFTSPINPYYTDLLTNIDSDSGMHLNMFFWSQHHRAELCWGGVKGRPGGCGSPMSSFPLPEDYPGRAGQESPDLTALSALLLLHSTEAPTVVSEHCAQDSCSQLVHNVLTPQQMVDYCPDSFASHQTFNGNFSRLCTPLRTDSDLKAALLCPGPASISRDMCQKWATNALSWTVHAKFHSWGSNGEWRKKNFVTGIVQTDTGPI